MSQTARRVRFLPRSVLGWWSIGLFLGTGAIQQVMASGTVRGRTLAITALLGMGASAVLAVRAFFHHHDHAVVLALPLLSGLFWALFVAGEVLIGHG